MLLLESWLNKACDNAWYSTNKYSDDAWLSAFSSHLNVGQYGTEDRSKPSAVFLDMLSKYELQIRRSRAFSLNVRLDLDGRDAVRSLHVPANITFEQLHKILQAAFKWKDYHLYSFGMFKEWSENYYANPDVELIMYEDEFDSSPDAKMVTGVKLSDYIPEFNKILYSYDFGDDWHHYINVVGVLDDCNEELPVLVSGEGDSPPEDVGGPGGFADFLEILSNPEHEEYEQLSRWAKSQWWKPFDFDSVARSVKSSLWWW